MRPLPFANGSRTPLMFKKKEGRRQPPLRKLGPLQVADNLRPDEANPSKRGEIGMLGLRVGRVGGPGVLKGAWSDPRDQAP